jgi:hypothetical protein
LHPQQKQQRDMQLAATQTQADEGWELVYADAKRHPEKWPNVNAESAKVSYDR